MKLIDLDAEKEYLLDGAYVVGAGENFVEVVRCKECKYWEKMPSQTAAPQYHKCNRTNCGFTADGYCSYGERTEECTTETE